MRSYVKKHLRELIWFSFLNQTHIFLSHEFFEILFICHNKKKVIMDENNLKLMLRKTIFESIEKDEEGEMKWISEHNKKFRVLIKNDLFFLKDRSPKINKKWFLITYKQLIKMTYDFNFEEEDIDFFELIMEIDEEYKKMLLICVNKGLVLEDEVYSILNVNTDHYIDDTETIKSYDDDDDNATINNDDEWDDEDWDEPEGDETIPPPYMSSNDNYENNNLPTKTSDELALQLKQALNNRIDISLVQKDKDCE